MTRRACGGILVVLGCLLVACGGGSPGEDRAGSRTTTEATTDTALTCVMRPDAPGPYAAGHASYMVFDRSRSGARPGDATYATTGRPIAFSVWYPVTRRAAMRAGAAAYLLDPYYGRLPSVTSKEFEAEGLDPAFESRFLAPAEGRWPVVILSPGAVFPDLSHVSFGTRLASHGFVVVVPYHFGMGWWDWEPARDHIAVLAWDRPRDMSFLLGELLRRNGTPGDLFHRALRPHEVFAGGWSLGGYAALTLAAGDDSVCDTLYGFDPSDPPAWTCAPTPADPRFKALVLFDAGSQLLHFQELRRVKVPAIALGETWDALAAIDPGHASQQARQHAAMRGRPNDRVDVHRTNHYSFSDECEYARIAKRVNAPPAAGEALFSWDDILGFDCGTDYLPSATVHRLMTSYPIAFLKTYLLGEEGYRQMFTPRWNLAHEPEVELFTRERCAPPVPTPDWPPDDIYYQHQPAPGEHHEQCSEPDAE